ncbi:hypothetical protein BJ684DRAFT_16376 [Piptocephalis cylindrospora]|uniref:Alpha/Beta hydrolase protein n=1 Tax=Piptocephalis cylindrospora TaxID=1907219 RepID=A0A4P9Y2W2_9FUNG|nr:hypothetical protein BJ684DRAFT_16376 [Piptocephalis cylindrospora]|eukprot:RKP13207.1 hypothetical protein BJ684DRAFT_16376 [Piptocephalis cylindrospora]
MDHWIRSLLLPASGAVTVVAAFSVLFPPLLLLLLLFPLALLPPRDQPSVIPLSRRCGLRLLRLALDQLPTPAIQRALRLLVSSQARHLSLTWEGKPGSEGDGGVLEGGSGPIPIEADGEESNGLGWWIQGPSPSPPSSLPVGTKEKDHSNQLSSSLKSSIAPTSFSPLPTPPSSVDSPGLSSFPLPSTPIPSLILVLWIPVIGWGWGHSLLAAPALTQWMEAWRRDQGGKEEEEEEVKSDLHILALNMDVTGTLEAQADHVSGVVESLRHRYHTTTRKVRVILAGAGAGAAVALHVPNIDGIVGISPWVKSPSPTECVYGHEEEELRRIEEEGGRNDGAKTYFTPTSWIMSPSTSLTHHVGRSGGGGGGGGILRGWLGRGRGQTRDFIPPRMVLAPWPTSIGGGDGALSSHGKVCPSPAALPPTLLICGSREVTVEDTVGWACQEEEEGRRIRVCVEQGGMFGCGVGWAGVEESVMGRGTQRVLAYLHGIDRDSSSWQYVVR